MSTRKNKAKSENKPTPMSPLAVAIGARITARRGELGIGQADLARRVGMTPANMWRIERGRSRSRLHTLLEIADALEMPADALVFGRQAGERESARIDGIDQAVDEYLRSSAGKTADPELVIRLRSPAVWRALLLQGESPTTHHVDELRLLLSEFDKFRRRSDAEPAATHESPRRSSVR